MTQVIYIDVLFVINLIINYFILLATRQATHADTSRWRLIGGASLGALYSMIIFFPKLPWFVTIPSRLLFAFSIVTAAFGLSGRKRFIRMLIFFYAISFTFAGIMMAIWYIASPPGMAIHNGVIYMNISPLILILTSAAAYAILGLAQRFFGIGRKNTMCRVCIRVDNKEVTVDALIDSGHMLKEAFSGNPVVVCEYSAIEELIPTSLRPLFTEDSSKLISEMLTDFPDWKRRYRMIPCGTVAGAGLLPAFRADKTEIFEQGEAPLTISAYIAISRQSLSGGAYHALLSPEAI